jgi:hypothetical protein
VVVLPFGEWLQWFLLLLGLLSFLAAFSLWDRARRQPEDIPIYSFYGHLEGSRKDVYNGAIALLIIGVFLVLLGLLI